MNIGEMDRTALTAKLADLHKEREQRRAELHHLNSQLHHLERSIESFDRDYDEVEQALLSLRKDVLNRENQYILDYSLEGIWKLATSDLCVDFNLHLVDDVSDYKDLFSLTIETGMSTIQPEFQVYELRFTYTVKIKTKSEIVTNIIAERFVQDNTPCIGRRSWYKPSSHSHYNNGETLDYFPKGASEYYSKTQGRQL
jgi:hypothetical protein